MQLRVSQSNDDSCLWDHMEARQDQPLSCKHMASARRHSQTSATPHKLAPCCAIVMLEQEEPEGPSLPWWRTGRRR